MQLNHLYRHPVQLIASVIMLSLTLFLSACKTSNKSEKLQKLMEEAMERQMASTEKSLANIDVVEANRPQTDVFKGLEPNPKQQVEDISGPTSYPKWTKNEVKLGLDLTGQSDSKTIALSLRQVIVMAVENNLRVAQARLLPGISETARIEALAAFDASYFWEINANLTDTPRPPSTFGSSFGGPQISKTLTYRTGISKPLTSGATISVEGEVTRQEDNNSFFTVPTGGDFTYYTSSLLLNIEQPLLRGFGTDINMIEVHLAESEEKKSHQEQRRILIETIFSVEQAYWQLVLSRAQLQIQDRLVERYARDVELIEIRKDINSPTALMQARSSREQARANRIRAAENVRIASDNLKRLMGNPDIPLSSEILIVPLDEPVDAPIRMALDDAVRAAIQKRPEVQVALLDIGDNTLRQRLAENAKLPLLNVGATMRYNGLDVDDAGDAMGEVLDGDFIDYLLTARYEWFLGNRAARSVFNRTMLERQSSVKVYQDTVENVILQVKTAMRQIKASYELIGAARASRQAAAQNYRAFVVRQKSGEKPTEGFMDQKLRSEERLAAAELAEWQAIVDYNNSVAGFYQATGTLLEHNRIKLMEE